MAAFSWAWIGPGRAATRAKTPTPPISRDSMGNLHGRKRESW
jgi:hypothetical protein